MVEPRTAEDKDCVALHVQILDSQAGEIPPALSIGQRIVSWDNMTEAWHRVRRSHKDDKSIIRYGNNLVERFLSLRQNLLDHTWRPDPYRSFIIHEPKERLINAPGVENRFVQQMWALACEPIIDNTFIDESYACRVGKGQLQAVQALQRVARSWSFSSSWYVCKMDFRHYFQSIRHEVAKELLAETIEDDLALWIAATIIDSYDNGFPIGSLLSQICGNVVLNKVDHYLKDLGVPHQGRYMDDIWFDGQNRGVVEDQMELVAVYAKRRLGLNVHGHKCKVLHVKRPYQFSDGIDFCGCRVHPYSLYVRDATISRACRRIDKLTDDVIAGRRNPEILTTQLESFHGLAAHKDSSARVRMADKSTIARTCRIISRFS